MSETPGKILFIGHDASRTGGSIFLLRFLQWFFKNRQTPFRMLLRSHGDLASAFELLGAVDFLEPRPTLAYKVLRRLNLNGQLRAKHQSSLREKLKQEDIRLVYSNTIVNGDVLDFLSFLNCPVISHVHELEGLIQDLGSGNMGRVKTHTSTYIAVSEAVKTNLIKAHAIPESKVQMVHGFVPICDRDGREAEETRRSVFRELHIPDSSRLICACGSVERRKGADLFLELARLVREASKASPVYFLWVGGRADQLLAIRAETKRLSLQDDVRFIGSRPDVARYYEAADVFVLTSREDPFPLVMMEAALREKPIVCFENSGGAPEFVDHDAGIVIPGFDVSAMAEKVAMLLSSPELCRQMGAAGRQKVLAHHDLNLGAAKIAKIIEQEMATPESRPAAQSAKTEQASVR